MKAFNVVLVLLCVAQVAGSTCVKAMAPPEDEVLVDEFAPPVFSDCEDEYVDTAAALGIVQGDGEGNFRPDDVLTRAEFAEMCFNAFGAVVMAEPQGKIVPVAMRPTTLEPTRMLVGPELMQSPAPKVAWPLVEQRPQNSIEELFKKPVEPTVPKMAAWWTPAAEYLAAISNSVKTQRQVLTDTLGGEPEAELANVAENGFSDFRPNEPASFTWSVKMLYLIWSRAAQIEIGQFDHEAVAWANARGNWQSLWSDNQISRKNACRFVIEICELS